MLIYSFFAFTPWFVGSFYAVQGNLVMEQDFGEGKVHIRHGKMSKSRFSVDFRHPVSPIVALGVCCSTFANKMVVT